MPNEWRTLAESTYALEDPDDKEHNVRTVARAVQGILKTIAAVDNIAIGTHYYPSSTGEEIQNYADLGLIIYLEDGDGSLVLTVEGSNGLTWIDITKVGYRTDDNTVSNASIGVLNGVTTAGLDFDNFNYRYYRVKVVATGNTNSVIVESRVKP